MIKIFGDALELNNMIYYAFPTPKTLFKLERDDLRRVGLSFRKAEYVIDLSKNIMDDAVDLDELKTRGTQEIIDALLNIRGIGVWTAELAVIRGLHRLVVVPADDIGLRRIVSHYYNDGKPISPNELREIAKIWGKWGSLAIFYLVVADLMSLNI